MTDLLASVAMSEHLPAARESAQRTYDRRRARRAAGMLAEIPPNRWDDETKRIIATLATIAAPSRIDDLLEAFDGPPADHLIEITPRLFDHDPPPDGPDDPDIRVAMAGELRRMGLMDPEPYDPAPSTSAVRLELTAEERASVVEAAERNAAAAARYPGITPSEVDAAFGAYEALPMHDNGDYRA